jgi:hypothetical protein
MAAVPPLIHRLVAASVEPSRDLSPPLPHICNHALDLLSFFRRDWVMVQAGFEVLVVSFSALLW